MKLSQEETQSLLDMMSHDGMKALYKHLQRLVRSEEERVLKCDLATHSDAELARLKLRSEGAAKLLRDLETTLLALKTKHKAKS